MDDIIFYVLAYYAGSIVGVLIILFGMFIHYCIDKIKTRNVKSTMESFKEYIKG